MPDFLENTEVQGAANWRPREQVLERFEEVWEQGGRPAIRDFWPAEGVDRLALLIELVHTDLAYRLQAGEAARVDEYLQAYAELAADHRAALALIAAEYQMRRERDPAVTATEFVQRFPRYADDLAVWLGDPLVAATVAGAPVPLAVPVRSSDLTPGRPPSGSATKPEATGRAPWPTVEGYEILGELGRGGMGVVYQARQIGLNRVVALKMILAGGHASADDVARFRTEAEAVARLRHPNVVQIHGIGEHAGLPYFSLEYCAAGSLSGRLAGAPQSAAAAAALVEVLARAMHAAHQAGIVHRDLKPANVLLAAPDDRPDNPAAAEAPLETLVLKITDFGLAKKLDDPSGPTRSGAVMGTPSYMAPEQAYGRVHAIGPATDVYALCAILYEMLTGRPPFKGTTFWDTIEQVCAREPVPPRQLQPKVARDLETICLKGLRKEPGQRYASARDLADDLRRWLDGRPIQARPASPWERGWKWARRRPAAAALIVVAVLAGCTSLAAVLLYARGEADRAGRLQQDLTRVHQQQEVRQHSSETLFRARQFEAAGNWAGANTELAKAREALDAQPELQADELRAEVDERQAVVRQRLEEEDRRRQARQRLADFQAPYNNALFYEMLFTGLDAAADRDKTRAAARTALAAYGLDADHSGREPAVLESDRVYLGAAEHAQLAAACYELLLIWAEAEAGPGSGRPEADAALALVARAEKLGQTYGLDTRTFHLRKALYTAQSRGEAFDAAAADKAAPAQPTGALDWFLEALTRYRAGQYPLADDACREVLRLPGQRFWPYYVQALCHLHQGRWTDAQAELTICASERPDFVWPRLLRGFAASELGYADTQDRAKERLAVGQYEAAQADFDSALKEDADPLVQYVGLANRGALNVRRRRWREAIHDLREAIKANPQGFQAYVNLAQALEGDGQADAALAALDLAVQQVPNLALLYESRAKLHLVRKERTAARADFETAVARAPRDGSPNRLASDLVELGRLLHREGRYSEALARFGRALEVQPDFVLAERYRAETLLALNREVEAGAALDRYLAATPTAPAEVYQARGLIYADAGQLPAAVEMYTLELQHNPGDRATRCYRGWTYLLTDSTRLALADFEACLAADANNPEALAGRGSVRIRQRQRDAALADAAAAEQSAEKEGLLKDRLLYNLARIYGLAAGQLNAEARTGAGAVDLLTAQRLGVCRDKALDLLRRALEELPAEKRAAFWRREVQADPSFTAVRDANQYTRLADLYAGAGL